MKGPARLSLLIPTLRVGGTEIQVIHLLRGLARDFELTLICTRSEGALIGDARRLGIFVRILNYRSGWDFRVRWRLAQIFETHKPHILHTFLSGFDLHANRAAHGAGVPVIISSRRELATWQRPRHLRMQMKANQYVDCIVANSQAVSEYAARREGSAASLYRVIRNGVRADDFKSPGEQEALRRRFRLPGGGYLVGMVANFSPVKDHRLFVDMADILLKTRKDVHFLMVGTGPLVLEITSLVKKRGHRDFFTRLTTVGELADLYGAMDLIVLPSKMEGSPNVLAEAMASRTPVVAAKVGGVPELVEDGVTGVLLDSRSPADFAAAVGCLLDDAARRGALARRGEAWIRSHMTIDAMVASYRELYLGLLKKKMRPGA